MDVCGPCNCADPCGVFRAFSCETLYMQSNFISPPLAFLICITEITEIKNVRRRFNNISCWQNFRICESAVGKLCETHFSMDRKPWKALNVAKMESMVIASKPKLARLQGQRMQITHNGTAIKSVEAVTNFSVSYLTNS